MTTHALSTVAETGAEKEDAAAESPHTVLQQPAPKLQFTIGGGDSSTSSLGSGSAGGEWPGSPRVAEPGNEPTSPQPPGLGMGLGGAVALTGGGEDFSRMLLERLGLQGSLADLGSLSPEQERAALQELQVCLEDYLTAQRHLIHAIDSVRQLALSSPHGSSAALSQHEGGGESPHSHSATPVTPRSPLGEEGRGSNGSSIGGGGSGSTRESGEGSSSPVGLSTPQPLSPAGGWGPRVPLHALHFRFEELQAATDGFSPDNVLGSGGFGEVYRGELEGNWPVAIKRLRVGSSQGEGEFRAEVETLGRIRHRNVVALLGWCSTDRNRLLVYELAANGSLDQALHEPPSGLPMPWPLRMRVALGVAEGLTYLHAGVPNAPVVHRDVRPSNILLREDFEPMVGDFGLAKSLEGMKGDLITRVMGTFGYVDPEYVATGHLTEKSDVFSFGVVLLELVSGRRALETDAPPAAQVLLKWARPLLQRRQSQPERLADPKLKGSFDRKELRRLLDAAAMCVCVEPKQRPKMAVVLRFLKTGRVWQWGDGGFSFNRLTQKTGA